jgi:hypothetical protein
VLIPQMLARNEVAEPLPLHRRPATPQLIYVILN